LKLRGVVLMKALMLSVVVIGYFVCVSLAIPQDNPPQPERLHLTRSFPSSSSGRVELTASSIQRDLSSKETESIFQLRGNVEVRMITCGPSSGEHDMVCDKGSMVLRADAVDYNEKTGEIQARGEVHITPFAYK
jgi:hypothetical protein